MVICRALAVAEAELAKAGERMAEYQAANRELTAQAEESRQQLQVTAVTHYIRAVVYSGMHCTPQFVNLHSISSGKCNNVVHTPRMPVFRTPYLQQRSSYLHRLTRSIMLCWGMPRRACVFVTKTQHIQCTNSTSK